MADLLEDCWDEHDGQRLVLNEKKVLAVIAKAVVDERERCAAIAYRVCAETRHVTLGDKAAEAIRTPE